ncbi:hypothetical protein GGF32_004929 [Allomyces javanicus]|nr:hypothetical protein GGF32_004929 [Allomyces javanicus]
MPYLDIRCSNDVSFCMRERRRAGVEELPEEMIRFRKAAMKKQSRHCARGNKNESKGVMAMAVAPTGISHAVRPFHAKNAEEMAVPSVALRSASANAVAASMPSSSVENGTGPAVGGSWSLRRRLRWPPGMPPVPAPGAADCRRAAWQRNLGSRGGCAY